MAKKQTSEAKWRIEVSCDRVGKKVYDQSGDSPKRDDAISMFCKEFSVKSDMVKASLLKNGKGENKT